MSDATMNNKNDWRADQADAPDNNEGELNEQQLGDVSGGFRASRGNQADGPSDWRARNDDKSDWRARNDDRSDAKAL